MTRPRWGLRAYLALMGLCGAGSLHRGRFDGLGLVVVIGAGAGVFVLLYCAAHEDVDR
ncbi:MAG: hypothetical protein ACJ71Y_01220 [Blastococcus sp.]